MEQDLSWSDLKNSCCKHKITRVGWAWFKNKQPYRTIINLFAAWSKYCHLNTVLHQSAPYFLRCVVRMLINNIAHGTPCQMWKLRNMKPPWPIIITLEFTVYTPIKKVNKFRIIDICSNTIVYYVNKHLNWIFIYSITFLHTLEQFQIQLTYRLIKEIDTVCQVY